MTFVCVAACGGGDEAPLTPAGPSSTTSPPPSGVPLVVGTWTGTSDFEQANNVHLITTLSLNVASQNDRNIDGTVRFTAAGWESWTGTFSGTLSGTVDPEFVGTVRIEAEPATGTGRCRGQMTMSGRTTTRMMRWDAATLTMAPSVASEAPACLGTVRNIAWIFSRN
jgi:hypothetical protein